MESMLDNIDIDNNDYSSDYASRPTIIGEIKRKIFTKTFASKWANLKLFLKEKKSLELSVKLRKKNTIDQFSSKCQEIFQKKVEINLITKKNRQMFKSFNNDSEGLIIDNNIYYINQKISKMKIFDASKAFEYKSNAMKDFLFAFRNNNRLMLYLIECAHNYQYEDLVSFLCHFFYENFYIESTEQEEMLYIIYLLLEKEIDSLFTPSVSTFLEQSFISKFLTEMGTRYEIKLYIDIILNDLIKQIEEKNITYNSMNILSNQSKNEEGVFYDMTEEDGFYFDSKGKNEIKNKKRNDSIVHKNDFKLEDNLIAQPMKKMKQSVFLSNESNLTFKGSTISILDIKNNSNYASNIPLKKEINQDLFNNINERFIRNKLKIEKDEIMKQFYIRQLRKIQASKNSDLFNGNKYYNILKKEEKIFKSSVDEFNNGYFLIIEFINHLLTNLENNTIVPYAIKVICLFINTLLKKRFKNITKIQCNILICQYLFDKLIFPVLQNPDINDIGKDIIISLNTRKTLLDIYDVCKKLVRGELFNIYDRPYFVIFNKYIINNYPRINDIIEKIIHVKAPEKLMKLSEQLNEDFNLDKLNRKDNDINYDYFLENKNDFMQHKSICFSIKDLSLLYHIVKGNKEPFTEITKTFEELSSYMEKLENDKSIENNFYVITSDEYTAEVNELFNHEESKLTLSKVKNIENIIINIKSCIEYVINNVEIFQSWKWVNDNWDTYRTFQFIHTYLTTYNLDSRNYLKNQEEVIPLSWYSLYIINNLKKLKGTTYAMNDYQILYDILESEATYRLKKLRKLNNFLTINVSTKFILIDHKIKILNQELENVKKTQLNIKTVQFIENTKIKVCLTTVNDLYEISKYIQNFYDHFDTDSDNKFVLVTRNKKNNCVHKTKMDNRYYQKEKAFIKKMHCKNINQFCLHFAEYYKNIFKDIINKKNQNFTNTNIKMKYKQSSAKEVLEIYMNHLKELIEESDIFNNDESMKNTREKEKQNSLYKIRNYILKNIYIKIFENEINDEDKTFRMICKKLAWIKPENFKIPEGVFSSTLLKKAEYHIKKMDNSSTPEVILNQFGLGVQLINSMLFFMNNRKKEENTEPDELLWPIFYLVINSKPKRMIFNINFINYFIEKNQLLGNNGYNLIQAQSSAVFIQNLTGQQIKMDEEEFNKRCNDCINIKNYNKNKSINDDSDWE